MKRNIYLIVLFLSLAGFRNTGTRTIHGTVYDKADGSEMPGANIQVSGSETRTITDRRGRYSIVVKEGQTDLVFTYPIGYDRQQVKIGKSNKLKVYLIPTVINPDMIPVGPY